MARIPIAPLPGQLQTGNQTVRTAQMPVQERSAMAQGLAAVADVGTRVVQLARRADDFKNLTQASIAMQEAQVAFSAWQQTNPNEADWLGKWQETVQGVQSKIAEMPLTDEARQQMTGRFSTWSTNGTIQVNAEAFRQKGKNALQSLDNAKQLGIQTGDWTAFDTAVEDPSLRDLVPEPQIEAFKLDGNAAKMTKFAEDYKSKRGQAIAERNYALASLLDEEARDMNVLSADQYEVLNKQNVMDQLIADVELKAEVDPVGAKEMLKTYDIPAPQRRQLDAFISEQERTKQIGEMKDIADKVATSQIRRGSDVQFSFITSPAEQAKIKAEIDAMPPTQDELVLEMLSLEEAIDSFDVEAFGNRNPDEMRKMIGISARVDRLPTHVKKAISDKWQGRRNGTLPTTKESFVSSGLKVINEMVAERRAEFFDKKKIVKEEKRQEFAAFELEMTRMANEIKRLMPDNPTPQQAMEIINQVTGESVSAQMMDAFRPIKAQGVEPAMPSGSGSMNPLLFPNVTR